MLPMTLNLFGNTKKLQIFYHQAICQDMALIQVDSQDLPLFDLPLYLQELFGISLKDSV